MNGFIKGWIADGWRERERATDRPIIISSKLIIFFPL